MVGKRSGFRCIREVVVFSTNGGFICPVCKKFNAAIRYPINHWTYCYEDCYNTPLDESEAYFPTNNFKLICKKVLDEI